MVKRPCRSHTSPPNPADKFLVIRQRRGDQYVPRLKRAAGKLGRDMSQIVREALDQRLAELGV